MLNPIEERIQKLEWLSDKGIMSQDAIAISLLIALNEVVKSLDYIAEKLEGGKY